MPPGPADADEEEEEMTAAGPAGSSGAGSANCAAPGAGVLPFPFRRLNHHFGVRKSPRAPTRSYCRLLCMTSKSAAACLPLAILDLTADGAAARVVHVVLPPFGIG